jgi:hypothetical protein
MVIVGHTSPDWDCIGAIWLLMRYGGMEGADVRFVNTGAPDADVIASADAVVDTGREYDPTRLRFDHHHLPGAAASETCAAFQVFQHLAPNGELVHLAPLNALILHGDTGSRMYGAEWSRLVGIHALLSVRKARKAGDLALLTWGLDILDDLAEHLKARYEAKEALAACIVYHSDDGLVIALKEAPIQATYAAFEASARLVLFQSTGEATNAIGIQRAGEWQEPHCGELVQAVIAWQAHQEGYAAELLPDMLKSPLVQELASWYRHEAGFFAGRGTAKAPDPRPIEADLTDIARAIDAAWQR